MIAHQRLPRQRRSALTLAILLSGCGGGGGSSAPSTGVAVVSSSAAALPETPAPTPTPTPVPTPTPAASLAADATATVAPSLAGVAAIASNFDTAAYLQPAWGTGAIPVSAAPDVVGAFRFLCAPSHNAYVDPIVYPGQTGRSHLHTFFGNTKTDANSTYASLRTTGESSCNNLLNRSAYWMPALMNGQGKVVMPDFVSIYYKRRPASDPECQREGKACIALPRGLRYVFGYNMNNPAQGSGFYFTCQGTGAIQGSYPNIPQAAKACPAGAQLGAVISAPSCWNGTDLDSPDHRSHMAFPSYGTWGYLKCPATHPYVVPTFTMAAWYTTDETLDRSGSEAVDARTWYFASDRMAGMAPQTPGSTFHADWYGAWDDGIMQQWTANCIDRLLNCSGGDLGNGKQMKALAGYTYKAAQRLVDPPS